MFRPADEVPALGGYAATPQTILRLTSMVWRLPPDALIVECGSGSSTVWLALACRQAGHGRVVALEHHDHYAGLTKEALARHGLDDIAEVRVAPLAPVTVGGEKHDWYAGSTWSDLRGIDLLFVDGPPGHLGPRARYPALPLLADALDDGAVVALDDAQRPDEADIATDWLAADVDGIRLGDEGLVGRTRFFTATRTSGDRGGTPLG
jgi:predicted O-methyltransferase YrrM